MDGDRLGSGEDIGIDRHIDRLTFGYRDLFRSLTLAYKRYKAHQAKGRKCQGLLIQPALHGVTAFLRDEMHLSMINAFMISYLMENFIHGYGYYSLFGMNFDPVDPMER